MTFPAPAESLSCLPAMCHRAPHLQNGQARLGLQHLDTDPLCAVLVVFYLQVSGCCSGQVKTDRPIHRKARQSTPPGAAACGTLMRALRMRHAQPSTLNPKPKP